MRILGLTFVASLTAAADEQKRFLRDVLGLEEQPVEGSGTDFFHLPDGSTVGVHPVAPGEETRTVGFLVDDLEDGIAHLEAAGIATDGIAVTGPWRYTHFTAPDGQLYELVELVR